MLTTLALILSLSLLSFGSTTAEARWALFIVWVLAFTGLALKTLFRPDAKGIGYRAAILIALLMGLGLLTDVGVVFGPIAAIWAWAAVRKDPTRVRVFLHFLLAVGILEALLGLAQYLIAPGWILGYVNDAYVTTGTLINRNHFAGLLGMLAPVALGLGYVSMQRRHGEVSRSYLYFASGALMGLALVFSLSRMGILSFFLTLTFLWLLVRYSDQIRQARRTPAFVFVTLLLTAAAVLWIGVDAVVARYGELIGEEGAVNQVRVFVFRDTLSLIADNPTGIGPGAYRDVFRQYQTARTDLLFDHAHNDYLETMAEWGIAVAAVFWGMLFYLFGRCVRTVRGTADARLRGYLIACVGAMFSIFIHSLADFNLQIPSNSMVFFTFVGMAVALPTSLRALHAGREQPPTSD